MTIAAFKITNLIRKVAEQNRRERYYKSCFDKIKGLLYGYKTRRILNLEKLQDLRKAIKTIQIKIDACESARQY